MIKNNIPSNAMLILANMVSLMGVLFLGWDAKGVFVIYIIETIIIGLLNVLKMLTVYILNGNRNEPAPSAGSGVRGAGLIPFFIFHYSFFIFVQSVLFFAFSSIWQPVKGPEALDVIANFIPYFTGGTQLAIISLAIANFTYLINDFILGGKYRAESMSNLMFLPYKRIFVQQVVVILGGGIFMASGSATAVAILFILLKTAADFITANYSRYPKLQAWIIKQATENRKAPLTKEQQQTLERMFKRDNRKI